MSFSSKKKSLNYDSLNDGETLFDFLKRKKIYNLQNTVTKNNSSYSHTRRRSNQEDYQDKINYEGKTNAQQKDYLSSRAQDKFTNRSITPKKIQFEDPIVEKDYDRSAKKEHFQEKSKGKSFLSMISPIKRSSTFKQQQQQNIIKSNKKSQRSANEAFTRKNITKSINLIKQTLLKSVKMNEKIKDKSHRLLIEFLPIFNFINEQQEKELSKIVGDLKNKMKSFQSFSEDLDLNQVDELIESFHKQLEEHIEIEEGNIRKQLEKAKNREVGETISSKDDIIASVRQENKKLTKKVQNLQYKLEKIENSKSNIEDVLEQREMNYVQQLQSFKAKHDDQYQQMKEKYIDMSEKCNDMENETKIYKDKYKKIESQLEDNIKRHAQQLREVNEAKQSYLLQEIIMLKTEFTNDINKINELHILKQADFQAKNDQQKMDLEKTSFERGCDRQIQSKILEQANLTKQENIQLKLKTQCLITDMYRMNEELYQHWAALKDIKMLTARIGNYSHFKRIYDDLLFNENLFK